MMVAITGSSGLIGQALIRSLQTDGHRLMRLVRRRPSASDEVRWDPDWSEIDGPALEGVDAVVHLAGEPLADGRWTQARKLRLRTSRIGPTRLLAQTLATLSHKPRVLVSASAVGYYGDRGDEWLDESSPAGEDFLAQLCADWERATEPAAAAGVRVVRLRTGLVLSPRGGVLAKLLPPFRAGLGAVLGPGSQYLSWIAIDDLVAVVEHALANAAVAGPLNAVAPTPVTNYDFTKTLGRVLGRPTIAPLPAFALRFAVGELADAALLASQRVSPQVLLSSAFAFRFPELEPSLRQLLAKPVRERVAAPERA